MTTDTVAVRSDDRPRVLILDDDPLVGATIAAVAAREGLEPTLMTEPAPFFEHFDRERPDYLIVDLVMPQMDGVEVIRSLAERGCAAGIILVSGLDRRVLDAARRAASEQGLDILGVLPKPFRPSDFHDVMAAASRENRKSGARRSASGTSPITEAEIEAALRRGEFFVAYQPKVECISGRLAGFEALVRWQHPTRGLVMPDHFIPLAERSGAVDQLTLYVFDQAMAWLSQRFPRERLHLALNVSASSLGKLDLARELRDLCSGRSIMPSRITLELTETAAMRDPTASLAVLTQLRMRGFSLSIDDFGTGFSSMVQLVRLPFSEIKVDRSFVSTALRSSESRAVIESIAGLAKALRMRVTAEGVEDPAVLPLLNECGCHLAQGYAFSRPLPAAELEAWIQGWPTVSQALWRQGAGLSAAS